AKLRTENQMLRQQNLVLSERITPLSAENSRLSNLIAQATDYESAQRSPSNELLKLRGEVARLRQDARESARFKGTGADNSNDPAIQAAAEALAARVTQLRQRLEQTPSRKIPELKYLAEKDWLGVAGEVEKMESEEEFSRAMSDLRGRAKSVFGSMMRKAL